jgi:hypothetical protein
MSTDTRPRETEGTETPRNPGDSGSRPTSRSARERLAAAPWRGEERPYDLLRELTVALVVVGLVAIGLAFVVGSPDDAPITLKGWATAAPADFVTTATAELGRTSDTASYGPPYSTTKGATQTLGPLDLQSFSGTRYPIDTATTFVTDPLTRLDPTLPALATWNAASSAERSAWTDAYTAAIAKAPGGSPPKVAPGDYGPVPAMTQDLLRLARQGGLDGTIRVGKAFTTDYTPTILFLGDGTYFQDLAASQNLSGGQWGVMNETGNYPGQSWLWLFSFWYQVPAIGNLPNADLVIVGIMLVLTVLLAIVPFIPGLRDLPRLIPIHRLVWRDYYRRR